MRVNRDLTVRLSVVFLIALAVRLIAFWILFPEGGWSKVGYGSEMGQIAANLAEGRGFSSPFSTGTQPTAWVAPLVPLLWALVFKLAGVFSLASLIVLGVLQCLASAGACCFYYLILQRISRHSGSRLSCWTRTGLGLLIFWPLCLKAAVTFWYFPWQECAVAALFWASVMWLDDRTWRSVIKLGLCAGLVALINPVPLVLLLGTWLLAWKSTLSPLSGRPSRVWFQMGLMGVVAGACMAPWMMRNAVVFRAFVPLRSSLGVELWQGNNPDGTIIQSVRSLHPALSAAERVRFLEMGERAYNQVALKTAVEYIKTHPGTTVKRTFQRIYVFWCSDVRGDWPWQSHGESPKGVVGLVKIVIKAGFWIGPMLALLWVMGTGRFRIIPYWSLFVTLFVCFPLPYYMTHVSPMYAYALQPYMILMCVAAAGERVCRR
jgi:hypothetical protein